MTEYEEQIVMAFSASLLEANLNADNNPSDLQKQLEAYRCAIQSQAITSWLENTIIECPEFVSDLHHSAVRIADTQKHWILSRFRAF